MDKELKDKLFTIPLHKACMDKNSLRWDMQHIYFTFTHLYVTNSYIIVKMDMNTVTENKKIIEYLAGKVIHRDTWKMLYQKKDIQLYEKYKGFGGVELGSTWSFSPGKLNETKPFYQNMETVIKSALDRTKSKLDKSILINPKYLGICQEILNFDKGLGIQISIIDDTCPVLIESQDNNNYDRIAIVSVMVPKNI